MGRAEKFREPGKHDVGFEADRYAFADPHLLLAKDITHSTEQEEWLYAIGKIALGIVTVRFIYRDGKIRIYGAGFWRKQRKMYEQKERVKYTDNPEIGELVEISKSFLPRPEDLVFKAPALPRADEAPVATGASSYLLTRLIDGG